MKVPIRKPQGFGSKEGGEGKNKKAGFRRESEGSESETPSDSVRRPRKGVKTAHHGQKEGSRGIRKESAKKRGGELLQDFHLNGDKKSEIGKNGMTRRGPHWKGEEREMAPSPGGKRGGYAKLISAYRKEERN